MLKSIVKARKKPLIKGYCEIQSIIYSIKRDHPLKFFVATMPMDIGYLMLLSIVMNRMDLFYLDWTLPYWDFAIAYFSLALFATIIGTLPILLILSINTGLESKGIKPYTYLSKKERMKLYERYRGCRKK